MMCPSFLLHKEISIFYSCFSDVLDHNELFQKQLLSRYVVELVGTFQVKSLFMKLMFVTREGFFA